MCWRIQDFPFVEEIFKGAESFQTMRDSFVFNGEHYKKIGSVAMGSKVGPNYGCLFVGYVEEQMLRSYTGIKPDLYKRYMNDVAGAASCTSCLKLPFQT